MHKLKNVYENPQKLWDKIRKMTGNNITRNYYLIISNVKLIQDVGKEKAHQEIWQKNLKISDENQQYDLDTERRVRKYLNSNINKITPYQTSHIKRLLENLGINQLINLEEIKTKIK